MVLVYQFSLHLQNSPQDAGGDDNCCMFSGKLLLVVYAIVYYLEKSCSVCTKLKALLPGLACV